MKYDSRQRIIDTAAQLVSQYGYKTISVNQIIAESGTSKGSFYYHFPNGKEDVVVEILRSGYDRAVNGSASTLGQYADLTEAFGHLLDGMIEDVRSGRPAVHIFPNLSVIALEAANDSPRITAECDKLYRGLREVFQNRVYASGMYTEEEARCLGVMLQTAIGGSIVASVSMKSPEALETLKEGLAMLFAGQRELRARESEAPGQ